MSTGISISSINRIKELAEEKHFAEALEILDTQNLDKSINPQFLRISGEIFRENKRYYDSRRILLKAHQMSPQGNRIIYELIQLYLELGYFSKAQTYYEQYQFNSGPDDILKDFVEYSMKKALGADVKELASILVPILERMPEDKWNFEAVLLYDKLGRKDKALDESRYILENFKDSVYVEPAIAYIDDRLDVDARFYTYPSEEQEEDYDTFQDLPALEEKILEADYLRMFPPEARIMVEAEDKDALEPKPVKEKKTKKKRKSAKKVSKNKAEAEQTDDTTVSVEAIVEDAEKLTKAEQEASQTDAAALAEKEEQEKQLKQEREAALEKLLSKKIDADKIKESAKQVAQAVKEIDTTKAKNQMKMAAESVKDNVKKATDVLGEAVGATQSASNTETALDSKQSERPEEQIMDGIIDSILEAPKNVVGQIITNEELDALIPDSLEAMSAEEIADIEARKEEAERLELEALEANLELEAKKKAKRRLKAEEEQDTIVTEAVEQPEAVDESPVSGGDYEVLKERFLAELQQEEEQPLDSLGFISVVHSDIDAVMEEAMPDEAGMLRQMIANKEYYTGEDSRGFESKASYFNHGFEVDDFDFEEYREFDLTQEASAEVENENLDVAVTPAVQEIYVEEPVVAFEEMVIEETTADADNVEASIVYESSRTSYVSEENTYTITEPIVEAEAGITEAVTEVEHIEKPVEAETMITEGFAEAEQTEEAIEAEAVVTEAVAEAEQTEEAIEAEAVVTEAVAEAEQTEEAIEAEAVVTEAITEMEQTEVPIETEAAVTETVTDWWQDAEEVIGPEESSEETVENMAGEITQEKVTIEEPKVSRRDTLRVKIILSDEMVRKLMDLKESR